MNGDRRRYLGDDPLVNGWDVQGLLLLAVVPVVAAMVGLMTFDRRDLGT